MLTGHALLGYFSLGHHTPNVIMRMTGAHRFALVLSTELSSGKKHGCHTVAALKDQLVSW
ncbi:MAG: hypothetical protein ACI9DF_005104 [Verrucomicrobiales bacterium]|jgi:hypothetical protein